MPTHQANSLPPIRLISFDSAPAQEQLQTTPQDLRFLRRDRYLLIPKEPTAENSPDFCNGQIDP